MHLRKMIKKTKFQALILFLIYCIILFVLYARYYFADQLPISGDGIQAFTNFELTKKMLTNGELPLWNKWLAAGMPITGAFTPILLFTFLPAKEMYYAFYIISMAFGSVFTFLYLKEIKCKTWASIAISTCYLLSVHIGGLRKSHIFLVLCTLILPAILYFVERYFTTKKLRYLLLSSVFMAFQLYAGNFIQYAVYTDIFLVAYLIAFGIHHKIKPKTMLCHGAAWGFSYLGLAAFYLAPQLEQVATYSQVGAAETTYETFVSYSIHPIKLLQMLFPKIFGENNFHQAFGVSFSSEMDIELFLGFGIFVLVLAGIILFIRDFRVRFSVVAMICVFIYAAMGAFPAVGKIVYQIPYIADFRCPARDLFLFIFMAFTIAAVMLSHLDEKKFQVSFMKITCGLAGCCMVVIGIVMITILIYTGITSGFIASNLAPVNEYLQNALLPDLLWMIVTVMLVGVIIIFYKRIKSFAYMSLCGAIALSVILQTIPYTMQTQPCDVSEVYASDATSQLLQEEIGNNKIWDAFRGIDGGHESIISLNRAMTKEMASINSYTAFNNPNLYRMFTQDKTTPMNFSGLLTGSLKADQNVHHQNSLLSMLGVKYIIDSSQILENDQSAVQVDGEHGIVEYQKEQVVIPDSQGELTVVQDLFHPVEQSVYRISFRCDTAEELSFSVDLYGGVEYDGAAQEVAFTLEPGLHEYSGYIMSGNSDSYPDIYLRVMATANEEIVLENFTITRMHETVLENAYTQWNPEVDPTIYVNNNARDILYVPDSIQEIDDKEQLYTDTILYDLDSVNYMDSMESKALNPSTIALQNIDFKYNSITANIETAEDTFVNFSQCYYPGWKAYVDGEETDLYQVNGLIMGMEVPAGSHEICFAYEPVIIWIGAGISLCTVILMIAPFAYLHWKKKKGAIQYEK